MDTLSTLQDVEHAVLTLKKCKSPGVDGVPVEVWKHWGSRITKRSHELMCRIWEAEEVTQQWKDAKLVSIFKKKDDRANCGNSRDIALLSVQARYQPK